MDDLEILSENERLVREKKIVLCNVCDGRIYEGTPRIVITETFMNGMTKKIWLCSKRCEDRYKLWLEPNELEEYHNRTKLDYTKLPN